MMRGDYEREPWVSTETIIGTACWAAGLVTGIFGTLAAINLGIV